MTAAAAARRRRVRQATLRLLAVAATFAVAAATVVATASAQDRYTDVARTSAHKTNIEELETAGLFDGTECGARKFCPDDPIARWTVAVWLVRAIDGLDAAPVSSTRFADVSKDDWWMPHIERLAELGVTVGCSDAPLRYCPDDLVTRGQMASFLVRAFRLRRGPSAKFTDTGGNVHAASIDTLLASGITEGCRTSPLRFCPEDPVTRGQMASFINRGLAGASSVATGTPSTTTPAGTGTTGVGTQVAGTIATAQSPRSNDTLLAATTGRACAIRSSATVTCWGGDEGLREHLAVSGLNSVVALSTSEHPSKPQHSCALRNNGDVLCWGAGSEGQLGLGNDDTHHLPVRVPDVYDVSAVAAGAGFTCAVHRNGEVSCWGANRLGQLGEGSTDSDTNPPGRIPRLFGVATISAGQDHVCAIRRDGTLSCWGWVYGSSPRAVATPDEVTSVSMGGIETCITVADGRVFCWDYGETTTSRMTQVPEITDAVKVSVGIGTACVLHLAGGVSCWGRNDVGQVGDGTTTRRAAPVRVRLAADAVDVSVSSGSPNVGAHACAVHKDNSISCWGSNEAGQLNDGTDSSGLLPAQIQLLDTVTSNRVPFDSTELLQEWTDTVVENREDDFPWLREAWDHIRRDTTASAAGTGGEVDLECFSGSSFGCRALALAITDMTLETVVHQLAQVYDLHTGLAFPREWGAVQLYFASKYPACSSGTDQHGATALADTMLHLAVPHAWLKYHQGRECRQLPRTPSAEAERTVRQGLDGLVPAWFDTRITTAGVLWTTWRRGPSLPALANLNRHFGGLCRTDWITAPLDPQQFPAANSPPFVDAGC